MDPYANYGMQKLFSYLEDEDRLVFLDQILINIDETIKSKIGTYAIQGVLEGVRRIEEINMILESLERNLLSYCMVYTNNLACSSNSCD